MNFLYPNLEAPVILPGTSPKRINLESNINEGNDIKSPEALKLPSIQRKKPINIHNLHKKTVVRSDQEAAGEYLRVQSCNTCFIYILSYVEYASIYECTNCTIVIGATAKILNIEHCEKVRIISTCRCIRINNVLDSTFHIFTLTRPILQGNNHSVVLAPYNSYYPTLLNHMKKANIIANYIDPNTNKWNKPNCLMPFELKANEAPVYGYLLMAPKDFVPFTVPFVMKGETKSNPLVLPEEYAKALAEKEQAVKSIRRAMRDADIDNEAKKDLQAKIEASFQEWLVSSGNIRQINDLLHLTHK